MEPALRSDVPCADDKALLGEACWVLLLVNGLMQRPNLVAFQCLYRAFALLTSSLHEYHSLIYLYTYGGGLASASACAGNAPSCLPGMLADSPM